MQRGLGTRKLVSVGAIPTIAYMHILRTSFVYGANDLRCSVCQSNISSWILVQSCDLSDYCTKCLLAVLTQWINSGIYKPHALQAKIKVLEVLGPIGILEQE